MSTLRKNNIRLKLVEGELSVKYPKGKVDKQLLEEIRDNKTELIDYLTLINQYDYLAIPLVNGQADHVLSSAQRRLWILSQKEEGNLAYNMPGLYLFEGSLDFGALEYAFTTLIERHEILRTVFRENEQGEVRQLVQPQPQNGFPIEFHDLRTDNEQDGHVEILVSSLFSRSFDLVNGPLLRAELYQLSNDRWLFGYVMHHIISDGWSMSILMKELMMLYHAHTTGAADPLAPLRIQYKDYAGWQQQQLQGDAANEHKAYWMQQFEGSLPVLEMPADQPRPAVKTYNGAAVTATIDARLKSAIKLLGKEQGGTLFMGLLAAVNALLYRYTNQEDIIIGTQIAGREHDDLEDQIGMYLNTLALRAQFSGRENYLQLFEKVKQVTMDAYKHQSYAFDELVDILDLVRDHSRHPLFDVSVGLQNAAAATTEAQAGTLKVSGYKTNEQIASKFDLAFDFTEVRDELLVGLVYNSDIYAKETAEGLLAHLVQLLDAIVAAPSVAISQLDYLSASEKAQLLVFADNTNVSYPTDATITSLFEAQAARTPGNTAVVFEGTRLTYKELNEKANRLGHYLREQYAIKADDLVGIKLERGLEMIISIMAILKSGGAYVPVDPQYPQDRIDYIIGDSNCKAFIDEAELQKFYSNETQYKSTNPSHINKANDLAYVIYTSGTTGKPKGALLEHKNVVRLLVNDQPLFDFNESDVWTMFHSFCFDFSVWEMYGALLFGGALVMVPSLIAKDPAAFRSLLHNEGVTILNQTPSAFYQLIKEELEQHNDTLQVRYVIFAGEALSPAKLSGWYEKYPDTALINMYGITETTVHVTYKEVTGKEIATNSASVGKAIPTLSCYVLDQHQQLLPVGVDGELYVGGDGVCRGYHNREELTAKKFIDNPFKAGDRLYRSGDKARVLANGELEYGGRIDQQVKIRGYRIELGEIENTLQAYEGVEAVVVIAGADAAGEQQLVAYMVAPGATLSGQELRNHAGKTLPAYMLPDHFVQLSSLPLTSNGKLDRRALPAVTGLGLKSGADYIAPRTATEQKLAAVWSQILGKERISVKDNFFAIGGHSLKATRLTSLLHKTFDVRIELKELFVKVTLEEQAQLIDSTRTNTFVAIKPLEEQASYDLSSSQRRLWVLSQFENTSSAYNVPRIYVFDGSLDHAALEFAFHTLIARHESLRTVFREDGSGQVRQFILPVSETHFNIAYHDLCEAAHQKQQLAGLVHSDFSQTFDLSAGPLLRASIYQVKNNQWIFTYVLHHIVSDGWTMDIVMRELMTLYNAHVNGEAHTLLPLRIQYRDYAAWQQEQLADESLFGHKAYWLKQFAGELPVLELPLSRPRPAVKTYPGAYFANSVPQHIYKGFQDISREQGSTLYMALLAAVNTLFYRYTGQEDIIIGAPIANREHVDLEDQVGYYANTLALRTQFAGSDSYVELLERVKEVTLGAYEHQLYPFEELVDALNLHRNRSRNPLFDVQVIMQNTNNEDGKEQGLAGLSVSHFEGEQNASCVFDLIFSFSEQNDTLHMGVEYNTDLYDEQTILQMTGHLTQVMDSIVQEPFAAIGTLDYVGAEEKQLLLEHFNKNSVAYPRDKTLVTLFEEQAAATPDASAVVFNNRTLSYRELDEQANRLANYLRSEYAVGAGDVIGIMLDRSDKLIIAILGIQKAGAAYVPIDPAHPVARKQFLISDTAIKLLITQTDYIFDIDYYGGQVFAIDVQLDALETSAQSCGATVQPDDLAYIIYTSGSTGNPKGVMIPHSGIVNTMYAMVRTMDVHPGDRHLQFASISFDASISEIFLPFASGGSLYIVDENDKKDPALLEQYITDNRIDVAVIPPAYVALLNIENIRSLKKLGTAGEAAIIDQANEFAGQGIYFNAYGPTEASICATIFCLDAGSMLPGVNVPIGKPIDNVQIFIIDQEQKPTAIGIAGEICIGGPGLAKGYLNQPELTAQKFIDNPFREGEKMYRTGDIGRWLPDGNIQCLGRIDYQVKIRGYRIELGEIEQALQGHADMDAAVVIAKKRGAEKQLIAYIASLATNLSDAELRAHLSRTLPSYMLPDYFVQLDKLPLTRNGKVDRKNLPEPAGMLLEVGAAYVAPRNSLEEKLVAIWQDILGVNRVGVKDNFFGIGGNSLKVIRLASQLHKAFDVKVELKDLFANIVLEEQATLIARAKKTAFTSIEPVQEQADYALSSSQRRLWILSQFEQGNIAYNLPGAFVFEGNLNVEILEWSFNALIARHEILRTSFRENEQKEIRQYIQAPGVTAFHIGSYDLREAVEQEKEFEQMVQEEFNEPFDLSAGPLLRASLYRVGEEKWFFSYIMHHIISDGWSMELLVKELILLYHARVNDLDSPLQPLRIQYKDYAAWQQVQVSGEALAAHKNYWLQQLEGELPVLQLAGDRPRPAVKTYHGETIGNRIDAELSQALRSLSQEQGGTLFMGLVAVVNALLYRYTGQEDMIVGTQIAGRDHSDLEEQIGMYLNTLVLRTRFNGKDSFKQLLENTRQVTLGAFDHQVYPFDELVDALDLQRDLSRNPLFDVSVVLQAGAMREAAAVSGLDSLRVNGYEGIESTMSKFDLAFDFAEVGDEIQSNLVYNSDIYTKETAHRLLGHLQQLLRVLVAQPSASIQQLNYLSEEEKNQLLVSFNDTTVAYLSDRSIAELFEEQAAKTPDNIALVFENKQLTYRELNEQSNRLANYLRAEHSIQADDRIALMVDRSEWLMIAILGILKSGAAYVPVDAAYPKTRKSFILEDTSAKLLITQSDHIFDLDYYNGSVFAIDVQLDGLEDSSSPVSINNSTDLAYVMYTSGSTGTPKGVLVEHRSVVRLVKDSNYVSFTGEETILSTGAVSFDATTFEYWGTLLNGGKLILCSTETLLDEQKLSQKILAEGVDMMWFTSGWLNQLVDKDLSIFAGLKTILAGGDKLSPSHIGMLRQAYPDLRIINGYGPTENTTFSLTYEIKDIINTIPVGRPISNSTAYILDNAGHLCPVGVRGEICVGGDGLSRGYLNQPELTQEKFVFQQGQRIYKTGDLGRWLPDGNIEFLGRKDDQVKIRGYRIELGEIEKALQTHEAVDAVVVIAGTDASSEQQLIAYITGASELSAAELRTHIGKTLPSYMVPDHFVQLQAFPLTAHGKVDKRALPAAEGLGLENGTEYVAPTTETEQKLATIWSEILGKEKISTKDNFFEIGGHSLKATRLGSQIHKLFDVRVELKDLFSKVTIEEQAELIDQARKTIFTSIPVIEEQADYALSSSQRRLWVLSQLEETNIAYNIPGAYVFEGTLDRTALNDAFKSLIARHEILRTVFNENAEGKPRQIILASSETNIEFHDLRGATAQEAELQELVQSAFIRPFNLSAGPLLRASLYQLTDEKCVFTFVLHHIISDGWSMDLLIKELMQLYNAGINGQANPLPPLRIQYKDYAAWQQEQLSGASLLDHKTYWLKQFEGELPVLELEGDQVRPGIKTYNGALISRTIDKEISEGIKAISRQQGGTLYMALLAAVNTLLHRYTAQEDIVIGSPLAGRQHAELEDQIGFYVNTIALRTQFKGSDNYQQLLENIKQVTLGAYEHQVYPFDELVDALQLQRDMSRNPLFDVSVVLQNAGSGDNGLELGAVKASAYTGGESVISKFDLMFSFVETASGLHLNLEYNTDIYYKGRVEILAAHLEQLMAAIVAQPSVAINQLDYLTGAEKEQLLFVADNKDVSYPAGETIISLFEAQVASVPDQVAIVFEGASLTYKKLNERANRLAHYLRERSNIQADDLIAIRLERSLEMVVSILAVLKSGGAYVPIDPNYPQERIDYMIADSNCKMLIDETELQKFYIKETEYSSANPSHINKPGDLAYVIYTSGTTGQPKGSLIEHRNVVRLFVNDQPLFDFNASDVWTMFHSYCFDFSVWEMYGALLFGGKLVVVPSLTAKDPAAYRSLLQSEGVTVLNQTPSAFYQLIKEELEQDNAALQLRYVIFGGEALSPGKLSGWHQKYPHTELINMYGITETTVHVTYKKIGISEIVSNSSNIGKPIPTLSCYVLDQQQQLLPTGVSGELYVGGEGVCRGYLNRDELTVKKFIDNPFQPGEKLYRSGDKARMFANGELEYAGRIDDQVKVRGYRIELGEIENALRRNSRIEDVVLMAKADAKGEMSLIAYLVSPAKLNATELRQELATQLPSYMLPAHYIQLDSFPLTSNGKINRKALPDPLELELATGAEYVAPRNEVESILSGIFEEVLRRQPVGIREDFFVLGGDSIKSIQIVSRMKQKGYALTIRDILMYPVIEDLAKQVKAIARLTDQVVVEGMIPLSPIQHYFFEASGAHVAHFNQSVMLASKERISEEALTAVLDRIVLHHDALRMVYRQTAEGWIQENKGAGHGCSFEMIEGADEAAMAAHCDRIQSSFNLEEGPLFKAVLFRNEGNDRLLLAAHHLVIDGVSWRILFDDLSTLYQQYMAGQALLLPLKTDSFRYWQEQQLEYAKSAVLQKEMKYWSAVEIQSIPPVPVDIREGSNLVKDSASASFILEEAMTNRLLTQCHKAYQTEINDVLLTALSMALSQVFGLEKISIKLEGHGRENIGKDVDVTRTIGWFTTVYPVVFDMRHRNDQVRQLVEVKESLHRVPNKGIGYGVLRYLGGAPFKLAPDVTFNYLGDFGSGIGNASGADLFDYSGDYRGMEQSAERLRDTLLDVSSMVVGGRLQMSVTYSNRQYAAATIERIITACRSQLEKLIERLSTEDEVHLSPVDFTYKGLSVEQLKKLNQIV